MKPTVEEHASRKPPSGFALYTRSHYEKVISSTLEGLGITTFSLRSTRSGAEAIGAR
jgi:hypothetical protein